MASMLNDYFSSVFNIPEETGHITTNDINTNNNEIDSIPVTSSEQTMNNFEITTEEVLKTLNNLKMNKCPGPDNIYSSVLKETKT